MVPLRDKGGLGVVVSWFVVAVSLSLWDKGGLGAVVVPQWSVPAVVLPWVVPLVVVGFLPFSFSSVPSKHQR